MRTDHKQCPAGSHHRYEDDDGDYVMVCDYTDEVTYLRRCVHVFPATGGRCTRGMWSDNDYCRPHDPRR